MNTTFEITAGLFLLALIFFVSVARRLAIQEKGYDERQLLITYKSYKYSMLLAWGLCMAFSFFDLKAYTILQTIFFTTLCFNFAYRIAHHSLAPLGKSLLPLTGLAALSLLALVVHFWVNMGSVQVTGEDWLNFVALSGSFAGLLLALFYRHIKDKAED